MECHDLEWDLRVTLAARSLFALFKSASMDRLVLSEMVLNLPATVILAIHSLCMQRLRGHLVGEPPSWMQVLIVAKTMEDHRGISLISVLAKWHMGCVTLLCCRSNGAIFRGGADCRSSASKSIIARSRVVLDCSSFCIKGRSEPTVTL